jgi:prolyl-tRNA editing enzyme YbaK/EbsC (Cys-tRNA(Pro) deacylase)
MGTPSSNEGDVMAKGSVERVRDALKSAGLPDIIRQFPEGTRTAVDAARAVGCDVAQIVKSMVFRRGEEPVLILCSGANRVDLAKAAAFIGGELAPADGTWVRKTTGFAIGGVPPIGHDRGLTVLIDEDLMALSPIWAAAGSPHHVFSIEPALLCALTQGQVADVKEG